MQYRRHEPSPRKTWNALWISPKIPVMCILEVQMLILWLYMCIYYIRACQYGSVMVMEIYFIDLHEIWSIWGYFVFGLVSIDLCHNNNGGVGGLRPSAAAIVGALCFNRRIFNPRFFMLLSNYLLITTTTLHSFHSNDVNSPFRRQMLFSALFLIVRTWRLMITVTMHSGRPEKLHRNWPGSPLAPDNNAAAQLLLMLPVDAHIMNHKS